ncbi:hypothetical protein [Krasilnikovia sp. MM14-A1259]|uniref:hypothetical protein n=1 Tax=Krasilnikovia sp. MM14-A1259 TaxID=3373539 RepID=UPI00399D36FA
MTRTRIALTLTTLSLTGLLGLTACTAASNAPATAAAADVTDEAQALAQVGFETGLTDDPAPAATTSTGPKDKQGKGKGIGAARRFLRKNTLHGEVTVQSKNGMKTVVVQRGTVTSANADGVTVKSTDGFSQTWSFGAKLRLVQDRKAVPTSAIKNGVEVGIAGLKDGDTATARLIAIK